MAAGGKTGERDCGGAIKDLRCESSSATWMTHVLPPAADPVIPAPWDRLTPCSYGNIYITSCIHESTPTVCVHVTAPYTTLTRELEHFSALFWEIVFFPRTGNKNIQCGYKQKGPSEPILLALLSFKAFMYNALVKRINVLAAGWNYSYKVRRGNCTGQISLRAPQSAAMAGFLFRMEIIDFVLISGAWSCLSPAGLPGLNSDLYTVTSSRLSACRY